VISRRNPQWFADAKTVKTPFGSVKFTESSPIAVASEEATVRLIIASRKSDEYLRTKQELDLDALATCDDAQLAKFGLIRTTKQNFKVETKVVDLGKAVKAAEKSNRAANKTAKEAQS
jgi:phage host-nuclease inhibitor protein Gam